jgi:hypothetical protein
MERGLPLLGRLAALSVPQDRQTGSADWKNLLDPSPGGGGQSLSAGNVNVSVVPPV